MEIIKKLRESDSIVIEGDKKIGKTVLSLYLAQSIAESAVFLTPLNANKTKRKIDAYKKNFHNLTLDLKVFSFRDDWVLVKNEYGFDYLVKDLEYFISHQAPEVIIFHKIDTIFDYADRDFIEDFFIELLSYGIKYKKKFIFTINIDSVNYDLIGTYLVEGVDLYLKMTRPKDKREVEILFSISPIVDSHYLFESVEHKLILKVKDPNAFSQREIDVVVITTDHKLKKLHQYILDQEDINLKIVDSISDSLSIISNVPDYLIFSQEKEELDFNICEIAKENNFRTLYLVDQPFVRIDDRLLGRAKGCVDIIAKTTQTMVYVLELEKFFGIVLDKAYSIKPQNPLETKDDIKEYIDYLIDEKVIFTIVKLDGKIDESHLKVLRPYDSYIEFDDYSVIIFLNLLNHEVDKILFNKLEVEFDVISMRDCIDIYNGDEPCID